MTRPIRELPERVAAQIAAGEVIERPAAVLKELLENALDAGARRIEVEIDGAGRERIAVRDDGCGIPAEQLPLAFRRHATSKLAAAADLSRLTSYGFRGEALPAIAAAAGRLRLTTRTPQARAATAIEFERGVGGRPRPAARAAGTSIEVIDLFAGQPARRAFLAGARAERAALLRAAADAALARPERSLRLRLDGRTPLDHAVDPAILDGLDGLDGTDGSGGFDPQAALREALAAVFSPEAARRAIWFEARAPEAGLALDGFAGAPDDARRSRERIRLFVNGRPVRDRRLAYAVQEAYRDWLGAGEFPLVAARLRLPPEAVDANVHPAKTEVKLRDPGAAFALLGRTVREALARERAAAPRRLSPARRPERERGSAEPERARQAELPSARAVPSPRPAAAWSAWGRTDGREHARVAEEPPGADGAERADGAGGLPPLRMVGQLHRTFIVAEGPEGLVLVDQHGAHERVLYERLLAAAAAASAAGAPGAQPSQPLLAPLLLNLDAEEAANWAAAAARLRALGFDADPFGERALRLRALPGALGAADAETLLRGVLADLTPERGEPERFDRAAASAACHGSVRRGQALDAQAMAALLRDLERCANPHSCPHGRPTLVEISADDVLREFRRK